MVINRHTLTRSTHSFFPIPLLSAAFYLSSAFIGLSLFVCENKFSEIYDHSGKIGVLGFKPT